MKAVFLDRDGVINENRIDHVKSWDEFQFLPGALDGLRALREAGWRVIVVTNQAIIHRHLVARQVVDDINQCMRDTVAVHGGRIDAVLYCPHRPEEDCNCRKPRPGMLLQAAAQFGLPLPQCYMVGDALTDIQAGRAVGCRTIMVRTGRGAQQLLSAQPLALRPHQIAADLSSAVAWMIRAERRRLMLRTSQYELPVDVGPLSSANLFS